MPKKPTRTKVAAVCGAVTLAFFCAAPAKADPPVAAFIPVEGVHRITVVDSLPDTPLESRELIFYPPGQAPTKELEYEPIPFESLLPGSENKEPIPTEGQ